MKRLVFALVLVMLAACASAQEGIYYETTPTIAWDAVTTDGNGNPLLPGDVLTYEVFISDDTANPSIETRPVADLTLAGSTSATQFQLTFPYRSAWQVGVRVKHVDGGGTITYSPLSYSSVMGDVASGVPFAYIPVLVWFAAPGGLRDSATPVVP